MRIKVDPFTLQWCTQLSGYGNCLPRDDARIPHHGTIDVNSSNPSVVQSWGRRTLLWLGMYCVKGFSVAEALRRIIGQNGARYSSMASEGSLGGAGLLVAGEKAVSPAKKRVKPRVVPPGGFLALNTLHDNPGSRHQKTRLGRGIGSGKGKTAGRGHKGQKARNGRGPRLGFEGGQTPLRLRIPKRGFTNVFGNSFQEVNLKKIAALAREGCIDTSQLITMKTLKDAGALGKKLKDGVKLLGKGSGNFSLPLQIEVSRVSERAKAAVEAAGGSVKTVHYNELGLRALLTPEWFEKKGRMLPKPARPAPRLRARVDGTGQIPAPTSISPAPEPVASTSVDTA